jgi:hypothetical protein
MTTLIAVYSSDGCEGRCDAKCYDAKEPVCNCICGGRNHGAGKKRAMQNTQKLFQNWIDEYNTQHPNIEHRFEVPGAQLDLL